MLYVVSRRLLAFAFRTNVVYSLQFAPLVLRSTVAEKALFERCS